MVAGIGNNSANVLHRVFLRSGENSCVEVVSVFSLFDGAKRFLDYLKSETTRRAFCTEFSCAAEKTLVLNVSVVELF